MDWFVRGIGYEVWYFFAFVLIVVVGVGLACHFTRIFENQGEEQRRQTEGSNLGTINTLDTYSHFESAYRDFVEGRERPPIDHTSPATNTDICPICLNPLQFAVATLCEHVFCGLCLLRLVQHANSEGQSCRCPMCRRDVTLVVARFSQLERDVITDTDLGRIRTHITDALIRYNRRYLNENLTFMEQLREIPQLIRHFFREVLLNGMIPLSLRLQYGFCISAVGFYLFLPYDLFPEAHHGICGMLDDAFFIGSLIVFFNIVFRRLVASDNYYS